MFREEEVIPTLGARAQRRERAGLIHHLAPTQTALHSRFHFFSPSHGFLIRQRSKRLCPPGPEGHRKDSLKPKTSVGIVSVFLFS